MRRIGNITAFFGAADVFSNWHPCSFTFHEVKFNCVEQFMMYAKAMLFDDHVTAEAILRRRRHANRSGSDGRCAVSTSNVGSKRAKRSCSSAVERSSDRTKPSLSRCSQRERRSWLRRVRMTASGASGLVSTTRVSPIHRPGWG